MSLLAPLSRAADPFTLTTADFHSEPVLLHGIDDHGVAVTSLTGSGPRTVPLTDLLSITRGGVPHGPPARFILRLTTGDKLAGDPVSFKGDSLVWHEPQLGDITVSARIASSIRRLKAPDAHATTQRTEDIVTLSNGDTVHGVLSDLTATVASVQPAGGGDPTPVPLDSIASVEFATTASAPTTAPASATGAAGYRIGLADESSLTAKSIQTDEITAHAVLTDATTRDLPLSAIQTIEQINGPITWLSSLTPSESLQHPFVGPEHPAHFDRSVTGGPIHFADHTFAHGIGVHAYSKLTWTLDPGFKAFRTQYAIDGDLPYADVTVRVLLDGAVAYEKKDVRAGQLSDVVKLDLAGKQTLTLEVDFGSNQDVQGRLNWIEPALLRR